MKINKLEVTHPLKTGIININDTMFETTKGAEVYTWWHHHTIQNVAIL